jgi:hypothetical protein
MRYDDLLDIFHKNNGENNGEASKLAENEPNIFNKVNLSDEAVAFQRKNSFLKSLEASPIVPSGNNKNGLNMSFKQNDSYRDNKGELIRDIKSSLI